MRTDQLAAVPRKLMAAGGTNLAVVIDMACAGGSGFGSGPRRTTL